MRFPRGAVPLAMVIGAIAVPGCFTSRNSVARRAGREFGCPRERIAIVDRSDVAHGLYDLAACGQRARYMCVGVSRCIREPDPPKWDPDPARCFSNDPSQRPAGCDPATVSSDGGQALYANPGPL